MRSFYAGSHWFWVVSRILCVLMFAIAIAQVLGDRSLRDELDVPVNGTIILGTLVLAALAIIELARGTKPAWLRIIGGSFLMLFGLTLLLLLAMRVVAYGMEPVALVLAAWFLLAGLRDFLVR